MLDESQEKLLRQIFSDAHVIDVDFSRWDQSISFCVVADHLPSKIPGRLPVFIVEFIHVYRFGCTFNHIGIPLGYPYGTNDKHVQWRADAIIITREDNKIAISISEGDIFPIVDIVCDGVEIRELSIHILDTLFPKWSAPFSGLVRHGIEDLASARKE